ETQRRLQDGELIARDAQHLGAVAVPRDADARRAERQAGRHGDAELMLLLAVGEIAAVLGLHGHRRRRAVGLEGDLVLAALDVGAEERDRLTERREARADLCSLGRRLVAA